MNLLLHLNIRNMQTWKAVICSFKTSRFWILVNKHIVVFLFKYPSTYNFHVCLATMQPMQTHSFFTSHFSLHSFICMLWSMWMISYVTDPKLTSITCILLWHNLRNGAHFDFNEITFIFSLPLAQLYYTGCRHYYWYGTARAYTQCEVKQIFRDSIRDMKVLYTSKICAFK